jgi:deoxyribodipyrimidine photo-lyase
MNRKGSERETPPRGALVLFTRDLRLRDQEALMAATRSAEVVVPAFVLDREILALTRSAPNRLAFLLESLRDLDSSLRERGGRLVLREGDVVEQAMKLVQECGLDSIHMSADYTPYALERHRRLLAACSEQRIELHLHPGVTLVAPGELTPTGGDHYKVFTPYWRLWSRRDPGVVLQAPRRIVMAEGARGAGIPGLGRLTSSSPSPHRDRGGEKAGREQLACWLPHAEAYEELHDDLPAEGTSRLSPYLHFGCLSPRTLFARVATRAHAHAHAGAPSQSNTSRQPQSNTPPQSTPAAEGFLRQLCWRDFHHQVLAARPDLPSRDYRPRGDRWRKDQQSLQAWREGLTGYPIVDAGMRQLLQEGFMHNRARLIVSSFLTKTLYIDWRAGAAHFAALLSDADVANNVGNWQWVAGTGNDTRPNRLLNPIRQAHRFDPEGDYVRRYLPELAPIAGRAVHEPWRLGGPERRRTLKYPPPLLDHQAAAAEFLARRGG